MAVFFFFDKETKYKLLNKENMYKDIDRLIEQRTRYTPELLTSKLQSNGN